jgi:hypothetical protein
MRVFNKGFGLAISQGGLDLLAGIHCLHVCCGHGTRKLASGHADAICIWSARVVVWWRRSVSEKKIANRPSYHPRQDNAELIKASRDRAERIARELADGVRNLSVTGTSGEALRPQGGGHSALTPYRPNQNNADLIKSSRERAERLAREESKPPVSEAKFSEPRADFFERLKFVRRCQLIGLIKTTRSLFRLGVRLVLRWQKPHSAE